MSKSPRVTVTEVVFQAGSAAELTLMGGYPSMVYSWRSTSHTAVLSGCRGGMNLAAQNLQIYVSQSYGSAYSDNERLITFSGFAAPTGSFSGYTLYVTYSGTFSQAPSAVGFHFGICK